MERPVGSEESVVANHDRRIKLLEMQVEALLGLGPKGRDGIPINATARFLALTPGMLKDLETQLWGLTKLVGKMNGEIEKLRGEAVGGVVPGQESDEVRDR